MTARRHLLSLAAAALALAAPMVARAAPMQLKFAFIGPPTNAMHKEGIGRWAKLVTDESGGEVEVKVFNGPVLATLFNSYDRLLNGVLDTHLEEPLSGEAAFCAMNKSVYARLPAKAKAAVDKYSGEIFSRWLGEAIDGDFEQNRAAARKMPGHMLVKLAPDERKTWEARLAPVTENWVKATPNGAAVLAAFREEIAKIRAGK